MGRFVFFGLMLYVPVNSYGPFTEPHFFPGHALTIELARSHTYAEIDREIISTAIANSIRVVVSYKRKFVHKLLVLMQLKSS